MANTLNGVLKKNEGIVQFIKFGLVGVSNTAVDWIVFFMLTSTFLKQETIAKAAAFLIAMLNSYLWNTIWTFRKEYKDAVGKEGNTKTSSTIFAKFAVVSATGWVVNTLVFEYTRFNLDQSKIIALIAASGAATLLNFFMNKFWTYKK